jgi:hypothetical protein
MVAYGVDAEVEIINKAMAVQSIIDYANTCKIILLIRASKPNG